MAVLFVLLFFVNAWLFFRLFNGAVPDRTALEAVFFAFIPVFVLVSWFGLLFAEFGVFSLLTLNGVLALCGGALVFYLKRKALVILQRPVLRLDRYEIAALVILLLAGILLDEIALILQNAKALCLDCIGIGSSHAGRPLQKTLPDSCRRTGKLLLALSRLRNNIPRPAQGRLHPDP